MPMLDHGPHLYYERGGEGEPMLAITGYAISSAVFDPILSRYREHFDVITYDQRWSGRSEAPFRLTSMPELAADAIALLDSLGVESAHVYGLSFGAMVAQEVAIRYPERVRGLVLGGGTPGGPRAVVPYLDQFAVNIPSALANVPSEPPPWIGVFLFSDRFRGEHPEKSRRLVPLFLRHMAPPWGFNAHWWASVFHDTNSRLHRIQALTLVLQGEVDRMAPRGVAELLAERIPDAELTIVPGAGHAFPLECPEESLGLLLEWMNRRSPIAPGRPRSGAGSGVGTLTRLFGLHLGALRTGRSLFGLAGELLHGADGGDGATAATRARAGRGERRRSERMIA